MTDVRRKMTSGDAWAGLFGLVASMLCGAFAPIGASGIQRFGIVAMYLVTFVCGVKVALWSRQA